jgi:hypothetical protein
VNGYLSRRLIDIVSRTATSTSRTQSVLSIEDHGVMELQIVLAQDGANT